MERNNDVYNHPQNENEVNEGIRFNNEQGKEQKIARNPNPRANENVKNKKITTDENDGASQAGSEITDGEDG